MSFFCLIKDHSGCCILDQLQRLDSTCGKARQESITIVQSGENKSSDRKGLIFLMLYKANLQDRAVVAIWSVKLKATQSWGRLLI